MVLARSVVGGTRVVPVRSDLADLPAMAVGLSARRYISLVATQLARAVGNREVTEALGTFSAVLLGGGPATPAVLAAARGAGIDVVPTYGMSETCGGCVYDGQPLDGVDVEVEVDDRITIAGPSLFSGYRLRPDLTATRLVGGHLRTDDRGRWDGNRLLVLGRLDDVVITGGLKVDLAAVERHVSAWAGTHNADGVALGVPDPEWGTMIIAVCEAEGALEELRSYVRETLPGYAAPRELVHVDPLPRLASGKPDRARIVSMIMEGRTPRRANG
jgi:O-succinylbenzoic acid--CoA ligase